MAVGEEQKRSPRSEKVALADSNGQNIATLFSPRFKSAAAMAGWDEEALLLASLIVEDTPDRDSNHKRRFLLHSKTPPTNSSRKRRAQRTPQPVAILDLDEEETPKKDSGRKKKGKKVNEGSKVEEGGNELTEKNKGVSSSSSALPCMDKLREELSCAICLEICYEPSTTPCGHSFCRKCLRSAADKCGKKCPKCRQLISNGRSCTVNTVLWNTIQLLFPQEIEARKAAGALNARQQAQNLSPETAFYANIRNRSTPPSRGASTRSSRRSVATTTTSTTQEDEDAALARRLQREIDEQSHGTTTTRTRVLQRVGARRGGISASRQHEDAALALRLQREEFMQTYRSQEQSTTSRLPSSTLARANLRSLASRAMNLRISDRRR
ncbi:E3 ubiquitin-protein ligase RNF168 [Cajanus cajan]|uniref:RING-type E3 ubiquitin transferase n=1 Tax=Cajanus cajan TaxID=3821 RepID=A0A151R9V9_CAJCA|nr:E3 ubiquitin-protein ligase RNF168 [Cajanus cajan]KYP39327.1 Tripartite motif-containing protein 65 [Cajanus cajan]